MTKPRSPINKDQYRPLNLDEREVYDYTQVYANQRMWNTLHWRGHQVCKMATDLHAYQEIIHEHQPKTIIETGTKLGGSALFFSDMLYLTRGGGTVISVDIKLFDKPLPNVGTIRYVTGNSCDPGVLKLVEKYIDPPVMVVLDSDHHEQHVERELAAYSKYVDLNQYLVVEDTLFDRIPYRPNFPNGGGPLPAVERFQEQHPEFEPQTWPERFGVTNNPGAWMLRCS